MPSSNADEDVDLLAGYMRQETQTQTEVSKSASVHTKSRTHHRTGTLGHGCDGALLDERKAEPRAAINTRTLDTVFCVYPAQRRIVARLNIRVLAEAHAREQTTTK